MPVASTGRLIQAAILLLWACAVSEGAPEMPSAGEDAKRLRIAAVENGGLLFTANHAGVSGTDAGYSIRMGSQTLWLFGDVFLVDRDSPESRSRGFISNCGLLVPAGGGSSPLNRFEFLTNPVTGLARPLLAYDKPPPRENRLWPLSGWYDSPARRLYLFYAEVHVSGAGPLDFRTTGHGLVSADISETRSIRFTVPLSPAERAPWWPYGSDRVQFGSAVMESGEFLYVYGLQSRGGIRYGKLSRIRKSALKNADGYEYYAGRPDAPRWSPRPEDAADVEGLKDFPTELSVSPNRFAGGFLAVHSVGLSGRLRLSVADNPWGPFRPIGEIATPPRPFSGGFCYAGKEHPELAERGGKTVYVTYVDSGRYWLQLLKVTLARAASK